MLEAKSGTWWEDNPQRSRSNNSAVIMRDRITKPAFEEFCARIRMSRFRFCGRCLGGEAQTRLARWRSALHN